MKVYDTERAAGLSERILSNTSIALTRAITPLPSKAIAAHLATAGITDRDLFAFSSILATAGLSDASGWNANDDVFSVVECFRAHKTAEHKQINQEHDQKRVCGHIISSVCTDAEGLVLADDMTIDKLPAKLHVVTNSVIYTVYEDPEQQRNADRIIADIAEGKLFVSMEALFNDFAYGFQSANGSVRIVERNAETAHFTRNLRSYGGNGRYGDERIGRVLKSFVFSGQAIVRRPANSESVIFATASAAVPSEQLAAEIDAYLNGPARPHTTGEQFLAKLGHESQEQRTRRDILEYFCKLEDIND